MFNPGEIIFLIVCFCTLISPKGSVLGSSNAFSEERLNHTPVYINGKKLDFIASQTDNLTLFKKALGNILRPRVPGTVAHLIVQEYIMNTFEKLGWTVELDSFHGDTPIGNLPFHNIIATHNPEAERFLDIACHYDSKYYPGTNNFVGATDSAVPCAMMIQMAHSLNDILNINRRSDLGLRYLFFDGEEAFKSWSHTDSLYGSKHLAEKWDKTPYSDGKQEGSQLDRIDVLVLLDLLGAKNPEFYSYFPQTLKQYRLLANAETKLNQRRLLRSYNRRYFQIKSSDAHIEDDHLPFLARNVPILHLIPVPFPSVWHTVHDNKNAIDINTTKNLIKILSVFTAEYLGLQF